MVKKMFFKSGILILIVFSCILLSIKADLSPEQQSITTHGEDWDNTCNEDTCNLVVYGGIRNAYEDNQWKRIEDARSLMNAGYTINYLSNDRDFPLTVVDFNTTSITFEVRITNLNDVGKDINFLVQEEIYDNDFNVSLTNVDSKRINFLTSNVPYQTTFNVNPLGKQFRWGTGSTVITISGTSSIEDATIIQNVPDNNYGGYGELHVGLLASGQWRETLIRFKNISQQVGTGQIIDDATMYLYLYAVQTSTAGRTHGAYRILKNWTEGDESGTDDNDGDVTYNDWRSDALEWGLAGAYQTNDTGVENSGDGSGDDRYATAEDSEVVANINTWYDWNLTNAVRNWYNGSWSEYGIIILDTAVATNTIKKFYSTESAQAQKPYLNITYHVANIAPVMNTSRVYSISNTTDDDLQGFCNATDVNGDNLSYFYEWYKDDELYSFGSLSNYTGSATSVGTLANATSLDGSRGVFVQEDYAYAVSQFANSLTIIDVTTKTNPTQIGYFENDSSLDGAYSVFILGDYAYISSYSNDSLTIINITTKTNPTQIGYLTNSSSLDGAYDIYVQEDYAYVVAYTNDSLTVINITNKNSPVQIGYLTNSSSLEGAYDIDVQGDYAYVASSENYSLTIINISNPASPQQYGYFGNSSLVNAVSVYVIGDYAYIISYDFTIINISDKQNPNQIANLVNASIGTLIGIYVSGNYAYATDYTGNDLLVIDVSDKTNPVQTYKVEDALNGGAGVYVYGDYAYVVEVFGDTLNIFDVADGFTQGLEINVNNITASELSGGNWSLGCRAYDGELWSDWLNSSKVKITSIAIFKVGITQSMNLITSHTNKNIFVGNINVALVLKDFLSKIYLGLQHFYDYLYMVISTSSTTIKTTNIFQNLFIFDSVKAVTFYLGNVFQSLHIVESMSKLYLGIQHFTDYLNLLETVNRFGIFRVSLIDILKIFDDGWATFWKAFTYPFGSTTPPPTTVEGGGGVSYAPTVVEKISPLSYENVRDFIKERPFLFYGLMFFMIFSLTCFISLMVLVKREKENE